MNRFRLLIKTPVLIFICLMIVVAGCSSPKSTTNEQQGATKEPQEEKAEKKVIADKDKVNIIVDPGDYATTLSMEKSEANPHPYNELRLLADEWETLHPEAKIEILSPSKSLDRQVAVAQLAAGTAADIIAQSTLLKEEDYTKGWVLPFDTYLDKPNPYADNKKWSELFDSKWLDRIRSGDGNLYFIPIDSIPIGIAYNKELFAQAGIDKTPVDYTDFFEAFEKLKAIGVTPYMPIYRWSDITLETAFYGQKIKEWDVLNKNEIVDQEELVRAYKKGLFTLDSPEFKEYLKFKKMKTEGYPNGWSSVDAYKAFVTGKVAMVEAVGIHMRNMTDDQERAFDFATFPFPELSERDSALGGQGNTIRGVAGYSTTWQITNSAKKKGTEDLAADFLMFITSPKSNSRMVNKLEALVPAAIGTEPTELFKPMFDQATSDMENGYLPWGSFYAPGTLAGEYFTAYENLSVDYLLGKLTQEKMIKELQKVLDKSIEDLIKQHNYDQSKW